jgi:hypothetical protein
MPTRHFHPTSSVENGLVTSTLRGMTAKLLEKEGNARRSALILQIAEPV